MRWLVMYPGSGRGDGPWVLAETSDEDFASSSGDLFDRRTVAVARDEALTDPNLRSKMVAWDARDDSAHAAHEAADEAEGVVYEAAVQIELDKLPPGASEAEMYATIRRARGDE